MTSFIDALNGRPVAAYQNVNGTVDIVVNDQCHTVAVERVLDEQALVTTADGTVYTARVLHAGIGDACFKLAFPDTA